jgi:hypothetical protein
MNCTEAKNQLNELLDGELNAATHDAVLAHTTTCEACATELASLRALREKAALLSRGIEPDTDLWPAIEQGISGAAPRARIGRRVVWGAALVAAAAVVVVGAQMWRARTSQARWQVTRLEGSPTLGMKDISAQAIFERGEWLRTDAGSRARLSVADVGRVDVGPATAVRLLGVSKGEHRIQLAEGELSAFIWAPPRLFFVETPSGVAEDLGCQYDLAVDRAGNGTLDVTLGFVSFERDDREVIVPSGSRCELRAGVGPGTPHERTAEAALRSALESFDFDGGHVEDLDRVLEFATRDDAVTLWHLIPRVEETERERVVTRLEEMVSRPAGVTHEEVLSLDRPALEAWWSEIYPQWDLWN